MRKGRGSGGQYTQAGQNEKKKQMIVPVFVRRNRSAVVSFLTIGFSRLSCLSRLAVGTQMPFPLRGTEVNQGRARSTETWLFCLFWSAVARHRFGFLETWHYPKIQSG